VSATQSQTRPQGHPDWRKVGLIAAVVVAAMLLLTAQKSQPDLNIDNGAFGLPTPPLDSEYNGTHTLISIIWLGAVGLIGFGLAIREYRRTKVALPLFVTLSAPMIIFPEVYFDVMGAVFYPLSESDQAFNILGRQMGWFIVAGWFGFGSLFMYQTYKVISSGASTKMIWLAFLCACVGATVFEEILQNMGGMYLYYGNQPLIVLWKLPWWWTPCNAGGVFLAAAIASRFGHALTGWKGLAMILITPASVGGFYAAIAMPAWIVTNGDYNWWVTQAGGLLTIAMGLALLAGVIRVVLDRDPFDWSGHDGTAPARSAPTERPTPAAAGVAGGRGVEVGSPV